MRTRFLQQGMVVSYNKSWCYFFCGQILVRMNKLCMSVSASGHATPRRNEQRLLRNMGVHSVVLDLLQVGAGHEQRVLRNTGVHSVVLDLLQVGAGNEQRILRDMGVHSVVLDLLQVGTGHLLQVLATSRRLMVSTTPVLIWVPS